jgi:signal peptidase I
VSVAFDSAQTVNVRGHVTDLRRAATGYEVGVALDLTPDERVAWVRELFATTTATEQVTVPLASVARPRRVFNTGEMSFRRRMTSALQVIAVTGVSVLVLGALLLALLGYRPMVVRSGSMVPTLGIGDVVIANWVHVDRIHPGEIVTFPDDIGRQQLITHRVQKVVVGPDFVHVQTKGDANAEPEQWSQPRDALVGHVYWRIPKIGRLLVVLGESTTKWILLAATTSVVLIAVVARSLRRRRSRVGRLAISPS